MENNSHSYLEIKIMTLKNINQLWLYLHCDKNYSDSVNFFFFYKYDYFKMIFKSIYYVLY